MEALRRFAAAIALAVVALGVWNAFPDYRPVYIWVVLAILAHNAVWHVAQSAARRRLSEELLDIRAQGNNVEEKLDLLDRKINALLEDAVQRRRR